MEQRKRSVESVGRLMDKLDFYNGKTVLITGYTGFKGSWMCKVLAIHGAKVVGYSLEPPTKPSLFEEAHIEDCVTSVIGEIRDLKKLNETMQKYQPEIVIHMAAQPIVLESYADPVYTYETNVMGTVNLLQCAKNAWYNGQSKVWKDGKKYLQVSTDEVYGDLPLDRPDLFFTEETPIHTRSPYSSSKAIADLLVQAYHRTFGIPVTISRCSNNYGP